MLEVLQAIVWITIGYHKENAVPRCQKTVALFDSTQRVILGATQDGIQSALADNQIKGAVRKIKGLSHVGDHKVHGSCHFDGKVLVKVRRIPLFHLLNDSGTPVQIGHVTGPAVFQHVGSKTRIPATDNEYTRLVTVGERIRFNDRCGQ